MAIKGTPDRLKPVDINKLTPKELLERGIVTERLETIPLIHVITDRALIDPYHAQELGVSMKQKRGQISPTVTRARLVDGVIVYDTIDGYHRTEGRKQSGELDIKSNVLYGCDDDEMTDLRILAASSVKSVQFPRVAQWITDSWASTEWAKKGLTVATGFSIVASDSQRSNRADLSPEEIGRLKDWVNDKCDRWQKGVTSVYQILRVVANADPDLVSQVRTSGGGKDRNGKITPARLGAVVDAFPGEENHGVQRGVLKLVVDNRYTAAETNQLVDELRPLIKPGMNESEVYELAADVILARTDTPTTNKKAEASVKSSQIKTAVEEAFAYDLEIGLADDEFGHLPESELAQIDELLEKGELPPQVKSAKTVASKGQTTGEGKNGKSGYLDNSDKPDIAYAVNVAALAEGNLTDVIELRARVADLTLALEAASSGQASSETWWRTATWLSPMERHCMEEIMGKNKHYQEVVDELKQAGERRITHLNVMGLVQSAYAKRRLAIARSSSP